MDATQVPLLVFGILVVAFLYSSVGHAGASGYIAIMTLCGLAPTFIRPTALVLNIFVACVGTIQFWRAGHFSWRFFWPFALLAVPFAFVGGYLNVGSAVLRPLLGAVLLFSAVRLFFRHGDPPETSEPRTPVAVAVGAGIGFLSGLTGTGGGIFLTPLLLFCRWTYTRRAAATSVVFILVNSTSGLIGFVSSGRPIPGAAWWLAIAAVVAGTAGSYLGSRRFAVRTISVLLATVLVIAAYKLIFAST
ncbi:MAG TPA: sulfite exporter TauE/SafE family protein [Chthoniobacterales bacterium]